MVTQNCDKFKCYPNAMADEFQRFLAKHDAQQIHVLALPHGEFYNDEKTNDGFRCKKYINKPKLKRCEPKQKPKSWPTSPRPRMTHTQHNIKRCGVASESTANRRDHRHQIIIFQQSTPFFFKRLSSLVFFTFICSAAIPMESKRFKCTSKSPRYLYFTWLRRQKFYLVNSTKQKLSQI